MRNTAHLVGHEKQPLLFRKPNDVFDALPALDLACHRNQDE